MKNRVEDQEGIPSLKQRLIFGGRDLDDDQLVNRYNIQPGCTLHLLLKTTNEFDVKIKTHTGKETQVICKASDTIESLKAKLREREGIPIEQQKFIFLGRQMDNKNTLSDYNINQSATI